MKIGLFSISSPYDYEDALNDGTERFLKNIENRVDYDIVRRDEDFSDFGDYTLNIIYVMTGGSEPMFMELYPKLKGPIYLLSSGAFNSLPASMEILSFLRSQGREVEILHGSTEYISERINVLIRVRNAISALMGNRLAVIGGSSDWLIASAANYKKIKEKLGVNIIEIPMDELIEEVEKREYQEGAKASIKSDYDPMVLDEALCIYGALRRIVDKYELSGLTVKCYELIKRVKASACLALAMLNRDGIVASCEGDVPTMVSMAIINAGTGLSGFMGNPSRIDVERGEIVLSHCSVPLNMVRGYKYEPHFETGISIAVKGNIPTGPVTVFKASGDLNNYFVSNAQLINNLSSPDLCRTQAVVSLEKDVRYFLTESIGNHHILAFGHLEAEVDEFFKSINKVQA